jgi:hypothetical protein
MESMNLPIYTFTGATALDTAFVWVAAGAFLVGAVVNGSGHPKIRAGFLKLGFPFWWCWVTSALELLTAALLIMSGTRMFGVGLGACIMLAAIVAVFRIRNYRELPPPVLFLVLLVLAGVGSPI